MLTPNTEAELADIVARASGPLRIQGGGTRPVGRVGDGAVVCTSGLSGISLYEPGALTLVAAAGTPLSDIEAALAAEGQRLAFEPMDHRGLLGTSGAPTIGGAVAANASGPRRVAVGACRDFLLGVRFVDGMGQVLKNGGRVMKNVTGYDLVKLMAGSWGTLGAITEVSLKVLPVPETQALVLVDGLGTEEAIRAMSAALGSPFEVTGAAHAPEGSDGQPVTMIRVEGFAESVAYRGEQLSGILSEFGRVRVEFDPKKSAREWDWVRDVGVFHGQAGDVWKISVKPSDAPEVAQRLSANGLLFDWGGGLIWALMPEGTDARARIGAVPGHATLVRANAETRARIAPFAPEPAAVAALSAGLRAKFDPRGILNPGLME